ncbi:MAG: hypothetical protein HY062_17815, partial [Bacteroidetes bacterium]|nr:hypothetical protein [Bacteroidota bacterium]
WKKYRKELIVGVGASAFLGDLGGRNRTGTDYSPADLEIAMTRPAISAAFRYKLTKNINWHSSFNYLLLAGDDKLTTEVYRNNRNLNFKSNVFEVATRIEFGISSFKRTGVYSLRRSLGRTSRPRTYELIGFVGVGGFYFNPKGKDQSGTYVALQPLHTEGQGLPGGPKQYKKVSVSIPIGLAFHAIISKYWSVGLEFCYRKTFTDYIDDVSTRYYDKAALTQAYGPVSAAMADPSKGDIAGATSPNADGTGAQRGDKQKDSFASLQITVGRFFPPKRGRTKLRSKF